MHRRAFIILLGGAAAPSVLGPLAARAQEAPKIRRVGIIVGGTRTPEYDGFLQGMSELGYVSGKDFFLDWRFSDGRFLRVGNFIDEFEQLKVDVIFVGSTAMVHAVRAATHTIPIVMGYSTDPIGNGIVTNLTHPGGNITGLATPGADPSAKQLELLAAVVPKLARVALLENPDSPDYATGRASALSAAQKAGLALVPADAPDPQDIDDAFAGFAKSSIQAVMVRSDRVFFGEQDRIADLALRYQLPAIFAEREFVESGGLMSYGESLKEFYRRAAGFVDKIFKGAKPGDLPIAQPMAMTTVINRGTAKSLGLAIPPQVVASAEMIR